MAVVLVLFSWLLQQFGPIGLLAWIWTVVGLEWFAGRLVARPREFVGMTVVELRSVVESG